MDKLLEWFGGIRLREAVYDDDRGVTLRFIYGEEIPSGFEDELNKWVEDNLSEFDVKIEFEQPYIDEDVLLLKFKKMLVGNFAVLLSGFLDDDISIAYNGAEYTVTLHIPQDVGEYIRQTTIYQEFLKELRDNYFAEFIIDFIDKPLAVGGNIEELEKAMADFMPERRVDKSMHVRGIEYYLGRPIKERPIKIEHLRVSPHDQVIAGKIMYLTKKSYKKQVEDEEVEKSFWTFVLDDGRNRAQCVFFPNQKSEPLFEKLVDGTAIAVVGVYQERGGRESFRVGGVSFCEI